MIIPFIINLHESLHMIVECLGDHFFLLWSREAMKIHRIPADTNGEIGILFRMFDRIAQGVAIIDIHIKVIWRLECYNRPVMRLNYQCAWADLDLTQMA